MDDFGKVVDHFLGHFQSYMGTDSQTSATVNPAIIAKGATLTIN